MKQEIDEPIIKYQHCLWNSSRYCEFEKLVQEEQTIEEDLIQLRLIKGMYSASHQYKIMELQIGNMSLNTCIDFIQQQELIQKYNHYKSQPSKQIFTDTYMLKKIKKMWTWNKKRKIPSICENLNKLLKKRTIFKQYANSKRKMLRIEENQTNMESLFSKKTKQGYRKIEQKEKDLILKVKISIIYRFWYANGYWQFGNAYTKKFLGMYWKANFTKEQFTTPPIWWVSHKSFRILWRFHRVRR